jgi:hypothetical protein
MMISIISVPNSVPILIPSPQGNNSNYVKHDEAAVAAAAEKDANSTNPRKSADLSMFFDSMTLKRAHSSRRSMEMCDAVVQGK